jgi:predicted DNA-binding protein YlxM (UPF0122 family)
MISKFYYNPACKHGEQLPWSKLNSKSVYAARIRYYNGQKSIRELAEKYDVDYQTMLQAVRGHTWKHVMMPKKMLEIIEGIPPGNFARGVDLKRTYKRGILPKNTLLTDKQANRIRYLYSMRDVGISVLAEKYGVKYDVIYKIVHGWTYQDAGGPVAKKNYGRGESATC